MRADLLANKKPLIERGAISRLGETFTRAAVGSGFVARMPADTNSALFLSTGDDFRASDHPIHPRRHPPEKNP